ncbi:MarR family winged helix-turn-helix transcriptional regulator [Xenophilus sp. Marseille-Q4582]|uniref:MarR family winged helix-turn-helix transcriptional regulator n=1 Tax=Xenophilus sp. Marseille-Q4582 TaxID=2866600 RepID=UPI00351D8649
MPPAAFYRPENYAADMSVGYMMRRLITAMSQAVESELVEPGGPTYPQWIPLHKLHTHLAPSATVAELARECQLDTGAMTRLLDRLEAKGLVRRVRSVADRRVVNIELTPEGAAHAERVPHVLCRVHNEFLSGFSEAEWRQLKGYLGRMLDNAQKLPAAPAAPQEP